MSATSTLPSSQHLSEVFWDAGDDSIDGVMLGNSICISIDGDGAAMGDDDRLDDDILLVVLNFDV